jgi:hypothetical protein
MQIDENRIQEILQKIWTEASTIRHEPARAYARWRCLYQFRNDPDAPGNAADLEVAAAEHFALAQYWVATGKYSERQVNGLTMAYETFKMLGLGGVMKHKSDRPTVPHSDVIQKWGYKGAQSGERMRVQYGIAAPATMRPIDERVNSLGRLVVDRTVNPPLASYEKWENRIFGACKLGKDTMVEVGHSTQRLINNVGSFLGF